MKRIELPPTDILLHRLLSVNLPERQIISRIGVAAIIFFIGFSPITALAFALMDCCSLPVATMIMVIPALILAIGLAYAKPNLGKLMLRGFFAGIIAVTCYDCVRIPLTMLGYINDFIPKIGIMLAGPDDFHFLIGYLWRYLGNGGGMGMAFVSCFTLLKNCLKEKQQAKITPRVTKQISLAFGTFIWLCLMITLHLSPNGEQVMFPLNPTTLLISLVGHLIFGYTLGCLVNAGKLPR